MNFFHPKKLDNTYKNFDEYLQETYQGEKVDSLMRIINTKRRTLNYFELYNKLIGLPESQEEEKKEELTFLDGEEF